MRPFVSKLLHFRRYAPTEANFEKNWPLPSIGLVK